MIRSCSLYEIQSSNILFRLSILTISSLPQAKTTNGQSRTMSASFINSATVVDTASYSPSPSRETLTIRDNRTGQMHEIPIRNNAVQATDFRSITIATHADRSNMKSNSELRILDPGFKNTAVMESSVTKMSVSSVKCSCLTLK